MTLFGVVAESQMSIQINPDVISPVLRALHVRCRQLTPYETPLLHGLGKLRYQPTLHMPQLSRVLRDPHFISKITGTNNEYSSSDSIRLFKVALYLFSLGSVSLPDLAHFVSVFAGFQRRNFTEGVPKTVVEIRGLLKEMNKFMPEAIIKLWLEKCEPYLRSKDVIAPYEFLFLVANSRDRMEAIKSLPYTQMNIVPEANGTYEIDEIVNYPTHPDALLECMSSKTLALNRLHFLGNTELREEEISSDDSSVESPTVELQNIENFRKEISNTALKEQIKKVIEECQQKLNAAKLGGRLAFEERHSKSETIGRLVRKSRHTQSAVNLSSTPLSRKSFFAVTHFSAYVPPATLFPSRPRFEKVLPAKRLCDTQFLRSRPTTASKSRDTKLHDRAEVTFFSEGKTADTLDLSVTSAKSVLHKRPPSGKTRTLLREKMLPV